MVDPVVGLVLVLVAVLVLGQYSVDLFSTKRADDCTLLDEGMDTIVPGDTTQSVITQAGINQAISNGVSQVDNLFTNLQTRCNQIKKSIDTINQSIPRSITDITVKSVAFVPWEAKDAANIQIERVPYKYNSPPGTSDCSCNYGCQWQLTMTLPVGPQGKQGVEGPQGPPGQPGPSGLAGNAGPRGNWAASASAM